MNKKVNQILRGKGKRLDTEHGQEMFNLSVNLVWNQQSQHNTAKDESSLFMLSCVTGPPLLPVVENNYITAAFCQGFFFCRGKGRKTPWLAIVSVMILQTQEHTVPLLTQWRRWKKNIHLFVFIQPTNRWSSLRVVFYLMV